MSATEKPEELHWDETAEYVVVGSGAGGGTVAARLAELGHSVILLEAGGDYKDLEGGNAIDPTGNRLPVDYEVPSFHALSTENEALRWDFWVRHYESDQRQKRDPKYYETHAGEPVDGVLYPRAGTLGGCTAHNALIFLAPDDDTWDDLARSTGDSSWSGRNMWRYFQKVENCRHRWIYRFLFKLFRINPTRHGFGGWLSVEKAIPKTAIESRNLRRVFLRAAYQSLNESLHPLRRAWWFFLGHLDPNDRRLVRDHAGGVRYVPLTSYRHGRNGTRERVLEVAEKSPDKLRVLLDSLATRVVFDDQRRALGVEFQSGAHLYRASANPSTEPGLLRRARATREVILAGGTFNTPQLLMLSGVGPREHLENHGIELLVERDGVGKNLQDRYEVGIVHEMVDEWKVLKGARLSPGDPQFEQWQNGRKGVYKTNGATVSVIHKATGRKGSPDLFLFTLLAPFKGYFPSYSKAFASDFRYLTWAILKGHTNNNKGTVELASGDPRDRPVINFHYFDEGNDPNGADLDGVVDGIRAVRRMADTVGESIKEEVLPGREVESDGDLRQFVKDHAWGHHASGSCKIGEVAEGGVLDKDFRVHGTQGLRVVDASVFPKIPGLFIVSAIYMIAEKAADVIHADSRS